MTRQAVLRMSTRLFIAVPMLVSACTGQHHRVRFDLEQEQTAKVMVSGFKVAILVDNRGPSPITATFIGRSGHETISLDQAATLKTVDEPTQIVIQTGPSGPAAVIVEAERATRFIIDQTPSPTSGPTIEGQGRPLP